MRQWQTGNDTYDSVEYRIIKPFAFASKKPQLFGEDVKDYAKVFGAQEDKNITICDERYFLENQEALEKYVVEGGKLILFISRPFEIMGEEINFRVHTLEEEVRANNFVARNASSKYTKEFDKDDFKNFYNADVDYQDLTAWFKFEWKDAEEILYTYDYTGEEEYALHKKHKYICAEKKFGRGSVVMTTLSCVNGCVGYNPVLDKFLVNLLEK